MADRNGFTLIELLAATVLVALLGFASSRVLVAVSAPADPGPNAEAALDAAWALLRADAAAAWLSDAPVAGGAVAFAGAAMPGPGGPEPARADWRLLEAAGGGSLVRAATRPGPGGFGEARAELVLAGVEAFAAVRLPPAARLKAPGGAPSGDDSTLAAAFPGLTPASTGWAVRLALTGGGERSGVLPSAPRWPRPEATP